MIIFATNYDEATKGGFVVAQLISVRTVPVGTEWLLGDAATRESLKERLESLPKTPLLAFSHGEDTHICGQDGVPAIQLADGTVIGSRPVFAYACWTGDILGKSVAQNGAIWWGFTGRIAALPSDTKCARIFSKFFAKVISDLTTLNTGPKVDQYLRYVALLCDSARSDLELLRLTGHHVDPHGYYCIEHILTRLRVWMPGANLPIYKATGGTPVSIAGL